VRTAEFQVWLREEKGRTLQEMKSSKARKLFARFVRKWNDGDLWPEIYAGVNATEVPAAQRTTFRWNLDVKADSTRTQVNSATNHLNYEQLFGPQQSGGAVVKGPTPRSRDEQLEALHEARNTSREHLSRERKQFRREQQHVLDELVPRKEGIERRIEKRRLKGAHAHGRMPSPETKDEDLLGSENSFEAARRRQTTIQSRKQESMSAQRLAQQQKLAEYKAKEDAKMQVFRDMVKKGTFQRL